MTTNSSDLNFLLNPNFRPATNNPNSGLNFTMNPRPIIPVNTNNPNSGLNFTMNPRPIIPVNTNNPNSGLNFTMNPRPVTALTSPPTFSTPQHILITPPSIHPTLVQIDPKTQEQIDTYRGDANTNYQTSTEVGRKLESFKHFIADLDNSHVNHALLVQSFKDHIGMELFRKACEEISQALTGNKNAQQGEQLLNENFRVMLRIKDHDGRNLLEQIAAHYAYQLENHRGSGELNHLGEILEKYRDLLQRAPSAAPALGATMYQDAAKLKTEAMNAFQSLPIPAKGAVCKRIYELDGGGAKAPDYGYTTALADIRKILSHKDVCPIKDAITTCAENTKRSPEFITAYLHTENIKPADSKPLVQEIRKLYELEDLKHFLNDPYKDNHFLVYKYKRLNPEMSALLNSSIWLASYQPIVMGDYSVDLISKDARVLLRIKNSQGIDIISQLIAHQQERVKGLRLIQELEPFASSSAHQSPPQVLNLFNRLSDPTKEYLRGRVWKRDGGEDNPSICGWKNFFGRDGYYGTCKIEADPHTLTHGPTPLISESIKELKAKVASADKMLTRDLGSLPSSSIDVSSNKLIQEPDLIKQLPPNLRVAFVTTELAGVASIGGLASAVEGMVKGLGDDRHQRVIMPLYKRAGDRGNGPIPDSVLEGMKHKDKYDVVVNGKKHCVCSKRINGIKCYFIEDPELFSIPPKWDGSAGNFYNGNYQDDDLTPKRRWAVFQSAAAELIYQLNKIKLQKNKHPVQLVHVHDAQTALIPKFLATRHPEEWMRGETPATLFTFHNNYPHPGAYDYPAAVAILNQLGLSTTGLNSFVEGLKDADLSTTVSETFAKEAQTRPFGKGMDSFVMKAALENRFVGIVNGNSNGWDPTQDEQLRTWRSVQGATSGTTPDLRFGPDSPNLVDKIKTCQEELCAYLKNLPFDDVAYANLDPKKPIVTYVGRFDSTQKGVNEFFFIMEQVLKNGGQFVCVGIEPDREAKDMLNRMKQYARDHGKQGVLILEDQKVDGKLKYQGKFGKLLRAATSVAICPSIYEPCGLVHGEFNRFGKKVIASRTGGFADTLKTEGPDANGYLFKRCDNWWSAEQEEEIGKIVKIAVDEANLMQCAFYYGAAHDQQPYVDSMRTIMRNALNSTWEKTPDGSLSPIRRIELAMAKAFQHRKSRQLFGISANLNTLKI